MIRTLVSALSIVAGALFVSVWAVSQVAVDAVEDGTAVVNLTSAVLDSPVAIEHLSNSLGDATIDAVGDQGINLQALGLDGVVRDQVTRVVESEAFATEVERQVGQSRQQLADALTDESRAPAPLTLELDASPLINQRLDEVPGIGQSLPDITLAPFLVDAASAQTVEDARTAYGYMEFAAAWFLWIGLAFVVLGFVISARKRWFVAKALLAVGVFSLGIWALLTLVSPETLAGWLPGDSTSAGAIVLQTFASESAPSVAQRMLWWGLFALVGSAIFGLIGAATRGKRA